MAHTRQWTVRTAADTDFACLFRRLPTCKQRPFASEILFYTSTAGGGFESAARPEFERGRPFPAGRQAAGTSFLSPFAELSIYHRSVACAINEAD